MKTIIFSSIIFLLAIGLSAAVSSCYSCLGNGTECPFNPTEAQLSAMKKQSCSSYTVSTICSKYSIKLLNDEYYTNRGCSPTYVGGTDEGEDFCTFVNSIYAPIIANGVIAGSTCAACTSIDCNT